MKENSEFFNDQFSKYLLKVQAGLAQAQRFAYLVTKHANWMIKSPSNTEGTLQESKSSKVDDCKTSEDVATDLSAITPLTLERTLTAAKYYESQQLTDENIITSTEATETLIHYHVTNTM